MCSPSLGLGPPNPDPKAVEVEVEPRVDSCRWIAGGDENLEVDGDLPGRVVGVSESDDEGSTSSKVED